MENAAYKRHGHGREVVLLGFLFMGSLKAKVAQIITNQLGLDDLVASRVEKRLAVQRREQGKYQKKEEVRSQKYFEQLKTLASDQDKRLRQIERRLATSSESLKELAKLQKSSAKFFESLDRRVQLISRVRHYDQLSGEIEGFEARYPISDVAAHVNRAVSGAHLLIDPCPHVVINDILPTEMYESISSELPPLEFWRRGQSGRDNWTVGEDNAPVRAEAAWSFMNDVVASRVVMPALVEKFDQYWPSTKPGELGEGSSTVKVDCKMYDGRLMLRRPGYSLEPHVDPRRSMLTVLMYMGTSSGSDEYGTKLFTSDRDLPAKYSGIYYPLREGAACTLAKSVPCRRNSMLVFASRFGIHGADIPSDVEPSTLKRYTYHFFVGIKKDKKAASHGNPDMH
tara:strand:+ start:6924 stop:8114 length:1191 start_codon:yes stop_codon:yes gene_type:complete